MDMSSFYLFFTLFGISIFFILIMRISERLIDRHYRKKPIDSLGLIIIQEDENGVGLYLSLTNSQREQLVTNAKILKRVTFDVTYVK